MTFLVFLGHKILLWTFLNQVNLAPIQVLKNEKFPSGNVFDLALRNDYEEKNLVSNWEDLSNVEEVMSYDFLIER